VADDNADMRQYLVRLLADQYSVVAVTDGEAALKKARQQPPDLILSDVMMPRLDGFGLLRELRTEPRTQAIPVIMLSARAGEESRVEGMEVGADDYLVKPFSARELLARVGAHLQMARLRSESEQEVRESEERLRMALAAARMVTWQFDPFSGKIVVSSNAAELFGLTPGMKLEHSEEGFALLHPDDVEQHRAKVETAVEQCGSYLSEFRIVRPDNGQLIWLEDRGQCVGGETESTLRLIGVMMDITERKRAEETLQNERDLLSVTFASIGDAVITTDVEGRITNLNGVAEALTGWTNTEAVGEPLEPVFHIVNEETRQSVENPATKALREGVMVGLANHTVLIAKDGTEHPIDDSAAPIRSTEGKIVGCVLVFRDVTERRRDESLLTNQNKVLQQVLRGGPLTDILDAVCLAIEQHITGGGIATVLLMDESETFLRPAAGGRCPEEYSAAIQTVPVGPYCGSCGTAAHRGKTVVVADIATDPLWADFREFALPHGLRACWSVPISSSTGAILGTFAVYASTPRQPSDQELRVAEFLARTAGIAIERHRTLQVLKESEDRYRLVGQAANDAIWDWNLLTNQVRWNDGLRTNFGFSEEQIDSDASWWIEHIHPDDRDRVSHGIHHTIDSDEELWNDEYRFQQADGSYAEIHDRGQIVRDGGQPVRMVGSMIDQTERNMAEAALRESEERFRGIFTQTLAGIAETDLTGRFVEANQRYCEIVGRSAEELYGMRMQDITHPDDLSHNLPLFKRAVSDGTPFVIEKRYVRPDGSLVWVNNSVSLVRDENDKPKHIVSASLDITTNKKAEAALRESESHFRSMADNAPTMIWVTAPSAECTYISKQWCEYTGTTQQQNLGRGWFECVHPDDRQHTQDIFQKANEQHAPFSVDYRLKRHDGEYCWAVDSGLPRFDDDGQFQGYVGTVTDIHDRKRAEVKLREQEAQYRSIFESTSDAILIFDFDGRLIEVNPAACAMHGYSHMEFVGMHGTQIVHPDDHHKFADFVEQVTTGKKYHVEGTHVHKNGELISIQVAGTSFVFAGRPALLAVIRDISEERKAVDALRKNEQRLRFIMDSMPQKIFTATPKGEVDYFNPIWMTFTGESFETIRDWGWSNIIHPDDVDENVRVWQHSIDTGEPFQFEHRFRRADGEYRWHISRALPMRDEEGQIVMWIGSNTEIHEPKSLQEELREVAAQLSEANRRKTEFLATLGHELRNPLAPIRTGLEAMKLMGDDPEALGEIRDTMERQVQQMVRLIDDLLDISRITQDKMELRTCQIALQDVIQSAVEATKPFIDEAGHELTVTVPKQAIYLDGDPNRLAQVFSNLLNNSAKYTPEGGQIWFTVELQGNEVLVTVRDDGLGIPANMLEGIFEMFTQIDRPLEKDYTGLGIGLTLVKRLVVMHKGSIEVRSDGADKGSEFTVRLPILVESLGEESASIEQETKATSLRILVVDDNKAAATMLKMVVKMLGNEVRTAHDGQQAIGVAAEFLPDVVLMDLGMPRMNGYEAARHIREQPWGQDMLLVALTGWGQDEDRERTQEAGFDHHLVKPAEPAALQQLLANHQPKTL